MKMAKIPLTGVCVKNKMSINILSIVNTVKLVLSNKQSTFSDSFNLKEKYGDHVIDLFNLKYKNLTVHKAGLSFFLFFFSCLKFLYK